MLIHFIANMYDKQLLFLKLIFVIFNLYVYVAYTLIRL